MFLLVPDIQSLSKPLVTPDEIFDYFIDVKEDLAKKADLYIVLSERATV